MTAVGDVIPFDRIAKTVRNTRPGPPLELALVDDFAAAPILGEWVRRTFIDPDGPLYNPRHEHLAEAKIGWLWTTAENRNRDRAVAGECRLVPPMQRKWASALQHWLWRYLFDEVPDFVITIDAGYAQVCDDWSFCALIEHELCHAGQAVDGDGAPRFTAEGGPMFALLGHDVEQFHDVVARYGARAAGVEVMARLANAGPTVGEAQIAAACGTCGRQTA
jgi:hypothetical protein